MPESAVLTCPECGQEVRSAGGLCGACRAPLGAACPGCGTLAAAADSLCRQCSAPLRRTVLRTQTPFVGRTDERHLLRSRFEQAQEGEGQVVLLRGEAGIGKSRLLRVLREDLASVDHRWIESGADPYCINSPFFSVVGLLQRLTDGDTGGADGSLVNLEAAVRLAGLPVREAMPLFAPLLDLALPAQYSEPLMSPEAARQRLLSMLTRLLLGMAQHRPLVVLVEDLQWADSSSLALLSLLVERVADVPLLLLLTARPQFQAGWPLRSNHTHLTLNRLSRKHVRELVAHVAHVQLPPDQTEAVVSRTGGVPLFIEELARSVLAAWTTSLRDRAVTLEESVVERLDRFGPAARAVAQAAAVIGRDVAYELLEAVLQEPDAPPYDVQAGLVPLIENGLMYASGQSAERRYAFQHALLRDATYQSIGLQDLHRLHRRTAEILSARHGGQIEPEVVAHHWERAGEGGNAVWAWGEAASQASRRGAFEEAIALARHGLELLASLPRDESSVAAEFQLQATIGGAQVIARGYGSAEADAAFRRVRELSEADNGPVAPTFLGITYWGNLFARVGPLAVLPLAEQVHAAETQRGDETGLLLANFMLGLNLYQMGRLAAARGCFEAALASPVDGRALIGVDLRLLVLAYFSHCLWHLGLADEARARMEDGIRQVETEGGVTDQAFLGHYAAALYVYLRDPRATLVQARRSLAACTESPNQVNAGLSVLYAGWALAQSGAVEEGIAVAGDGLEHFTASGQRVGIPAFAGQLADTYMCGGRYPEALRALALADDALAGDEIDLPDALRRRANLVALSGDRDAEVVPLFRAALDMACRHGDKAYELRAATSFGRWLFEHDRAPEATDLISPLLDSFTQGSDTPDVVEARDLLAQVRAHNDAH